MLSSLPPQLKKWCVKNKKYFIYFVLLIPFLLMDGLLFLLHGAPMRLSCGVYFYGLLLSFCLWNSIRIGVSCLGPVLSYLLVGVASFIYVFLLLSGIFLYGEFRTYFSQFMIEHFLWEEPSYFFRYCWEYLFQKKFIFILILFWFSIFKLFLSLRNTGQQQKKQTRKKVLILLSLTLLLLWGGIYIPQQYHLTIDSSFFLSAIRLVERRSFQKTQHFQRASLAPSKPTQYNVVLISVESWSKYENPLYNNSPDVMPFLTKWKQNNKDNFIIFPFAFSNSTFSRLSVPSIFTGIGVEESTKKKKSFPTLWKWGKSVGCRNIFVTSQLIGKWGHLKDDLLRSVNKSLMAENTNFPLINDQGIDDLLSVQYLCKFIRESKKPFLAVYIPNALHTPYQTESSLLPNLSSSFSRLEKALRILDKTIETIVEMLKKQNLLSSTLLIVSSDHGDLPRAYRKHKLHRLYSFYDEIINIPFFIRVPPKWAKTHPILVEQLKKNRRKNIANIDILPTLINFWNGGRNKKNRKIIDQLKGFSLFQQIPENRYIIALNHTRDNISLFPGFGIYWKTKRFLFSSAFSSTEGIQFYDIASDPLEKNNLWENLSKNEKDPFFLILSTEPLLSSIVKKKVQSFSKTIHCSSGGEALFYLTRGKGVVKEQAVSFLEQQTYLDPLLISFLVKIAIDDPDVKIRFRLEGLLRRFPSAIPFFLHAFSDKSLGEKKDILRIVQCYKKRAVPYFETLLKKEKDPHIQAALLDDLCKYWSATRALKFQDRVQMFIKQNNPAVYSPILHYYNVFLPFKIPETLHSFLKRTNPFLVQFFHSLSRIEQPNFIVFRYLIKKLKDFDNREKMYNLLEILLKKYPTKLKRIISEEIEKNDFKTKNKLNPILKKHISLIENYYQIIANRNKKHRLKQWLQVLKSLPAPQVPKK